MTTENKQWYNINSGINGSVNSICAFNDEVYAAGNFTKAGSVSVSGLAKWNGNSWIKVADIIGTVNSCIVFGNNLYVAGNFTSIDSISCNNIAKWNGISWSAVGEVTREIYKLKIVDSLLFALSHYAPNENASSGIFILNNNTWNTFDYSLPIGKNVPYLPTDNNIIINDIEKYSSNYFSARSDVFALATYSNKLIAGGRFNIEGMSVLKQYDGDSWTTFAGGIPLELNGSSIPSVVYSLNIYNNELYVGGLFNRVGSLNKNLGIFVNGIAKWNGQEWSDFIYANSVPIVKTIFNYESETPSLKSGTYVGGLFSYISGIPAKNIAVFSDIIEEPKTVYDLVSNIDQQCANILPCGFRINQPETSSECGPRDGIDGKQGPPGLPGQDGRDGPGCKTYFVATNKLNRSARNFNNPVDPKQLKHIDEDNISSIWLEANASPQYDDSAFCENNGCVDIPQPGGNAEEIAKQFNTLPLKTDENGDPVLDSRGEQVLDLSELNQGCYNAIDFGHWPILMLYLPNPDWDGESQGIVVGPEGDYLNDQGQQWNPDTGDYDIDIPPIGSSTDLFNNMTLQNTGPFLLPALQIITDSPGGSPGDGDCGCLSCISGDFSTSMTVPAKGSSNNFVNQSSYSYMVSYNTGCQIQSCNTSSSFINNLVFNDTNNEITFNVVDNSSIASRTGTIEYFISDSGSQDRNRTGQLQILQEGISEIPTVTFAKIKSKIHVGPGPKWNYTVKKVNIEIVDGASSPSWVESGDNITDVKNLFEEDQVVGNNFGYGNVELTNLTSSGFPLTQFQNFIYKAIPDNLIVQLYKLTYTDTDDTEQEFYYFSAPNPIVGQCETQIV